MSKRQASLISPSVAVYTPSTRCFWRINSKLPFAVDARKPSATLAWFLGLGRTPDARPRCRSGPPSRGSQPKTIVSVFSHTMAAPVSMPPVALGRTIASSVSPLISLTWSISSSVAVAWPRTMRGSSMGPTNVAPVSCIICLAAYSRSSGSDPARTTVAPFCFAPTIFEGADVAGRITDAPIDNDRDWAAVLAARATAWPKLPVAMTVREQNRGFQPWGSYRCWRPLYPSADPRWIAALWN